MCAIASLASIYDLPYQLGLSGIQPGYEVSLGAIGTFQPVELVGVS